jgi:hypothetical protein
VLRIVMKLACQDLFEVASILGYQCNFVVFWCWIPVIMTRT